MSIHEFSTSAWRLVIGVLLLGASVFAAVKNDKVPITTSSDEARQLYLKGRDLFERLQGQESLQYFDQAIARDPNFALAYLNSSFNQPTAKAFFERLNKAVALAETVSEGERLMILGFEAGVNGKPMKQREYYRKLVAAYPQDERAHNLLGNHYFGQQEFEKAIAEYEKATAIAPSFSQPYNQMGYSYRQLGKYGKAEATFKKYIELIPNDPNPYDSYAELLLKMGRFKESIAQYQKALSFNPNFVASHIGIATNLNYLGKHQQARAQLKKLFDIARNDGERRAALFATTVSYVHEGNMEMALKELDKQYAMGEKINDAAAMSGDLGTMGNILLESGRYDEALAKFKKSVKLVEESGLSAEIKGFAKRGYLYNAGRVALAKKDLKTAKARSEEFLTQAKAAKNTFQIWLAHELAGMIALEEKAYDKALAHFGKANQQNPYTFYRMALAYDGQGDTKKARKLCKKAAHFNALNSMNQAFVSKKAEQMLATN